MDEDPQLLADEVRNITMIMHITKEENVELASYSSKDITYYWVVMWKKGRSKNVTPISWQPF